MKSFKVGDRVRIVCPQSECGYFGKEATIYSIDSCAKFSKRTWNDGKTAYLVDVDGVGRFSSACRRIGYIAEELEPIVNPDEAAWTEFKRYLQPNPIILAKEAA